MKTFDNIHRLTNKISKGYALSYSTGNGTYLNQVYWAPTLNETISYAQSIIATERDIKYKTELYLYNNDTTFKVWKTDNGSTFLKYDHNNLTDRIKHVIYLMKMTFNLILKWNLK